MTPKKYVANLSAHKTCTYTISPCRKNGIKETLHYNGQAYSWEEFNKTFPISAINVKQRNNYKGANNDGRKAFLEL